jgi:hypothetical protein
MTVKRKRKRFILPDRTLTERAAIAACQVLHGAFGCPCEKAPSVCAAMVSAARAVLRVAAPDVHERLAATDIQAAHERSAGQ